MNKKSIENYRRHLSSQGRYHWGRHATEGSDVDTVGMTELTGKMQARYGMSAGEVERLINELRASLGR